jgi:hypothetical protein
MDEFDPRLAGERDAVLIEGGESRVLGDGKLEGATVAILPIAVESNGLNAGP